MSVAEFIQQFGGYVFLIVVIFFMFFKIYNNKVRQISRSKLIADELNGALSLNPFSACLYQSKNKILNITNLIVYTYRKNKLFIIRGVKTGIGFFKVRRFIVSDSFIEKIDGYDIHLSDNWFADVWQDSNVFFNYADGVVFDFICSRIAVDNFSDNHSIDKTQAVKLCLMDMTPYKKEVVGSGETQIKPSL